VAPSRKMVYLHRWFFLSRHSPWFRGKLRERILCSKASPAISKEGVYLIVGSPADELSEVGSTIGTFIDSTGKGGLSDSEERSIADLLGVWIGFVEGRGRKDIAVALWSRVLENPSLAGPPHSDASYFLEGLRKGLASPL
jgi:hypothetical protein